MTDDVQFIRALRTRLRRAAPSVDDSGFSAAVMRRIRRRKRLRRALPVVTGALGLIVAAPSLAALLSSALGALQRGAVAIDPAALAGADRILMFNLFLFDSPSPRSISFNVPVIAIKVQTANITDPQ